MGTKETSTLIPETLDKNNSERNIKGKHTGQIKLLNYNIQGLTNKIDALQLELQLQNIDIVCLTEHFMTKEKLKYLNITNFKIASCFTRAESVHGGAMIMVRTREVVAERTDIVELSIEQQVEIAAVELTTTKTIVIAIYRPPSGNIDLYTDVLNQLVYVLSKEKVLSNIFITGDFNINFNVTSKTTRRMRDILKSYNLKQVFDTASRVTESSSTLIDNVFTNIRLCDIQRDTVDLHLSDHLAQILLYISPKLSGAGVMWKTMRKVDPHSINIFKQLLSMELHTQPQNLHDAEELYSRFHTVFFRCFNNCFPERKKRMSGEGRSDYPINDEVMRLRNNLDAWGL